MEARGGQKGLRREIEGGNLHFSTPILIIQ